MKYFLKDACPKTTIPVSAEYNASNSIRYSIHNQYDIPTESPIVPIHKIPDTYVGV